MPYVSSFERAAEEKGIQQGLQQGILDALEFKFGEAALAAEERLLTIRDAGRLRVLHRLAMRAISLDEFRRMLDENV